MRCCTSDLRPPKEIREIDGKAYVLEFPIHGDLALIKAEKGDRWGNLTYRKAARNFGPVMATAATLTVASVHEILELGELNPEHVITPSVFVDHIIKIARVPTAPSGSRKDAAKP
jgi:3-oxoadipate CoA-transferase alpha subunit